MSASIKLWIVQSINCDDDEEEQAFATEDEARADYNQHVADGGQCSLATYRIDHTDRCGTIRTDSDIHCRIFNHIYDGFERIEYHEAEPPHDPDEEFNARVDWEMDKLR